MIAHPVLINRPIVVAPSGTRLCRPPETVLELLTLPQLGSIAEEDGEVIVAKNDCSLWATAQENQRRNAAAVRAVAASVASTNQVVRCACSRQVMPR